MDRVGKGRREKKDSNDEAIIDPQHGMLLPPRARMRSRGVKQSLSVRLSSVSIKIGKSQQVGSVYGIKWCKTAKKHLLSHS